MKKKWQKFLCTLFEHAWIEWRDPWCNSPYDGPTCTRCGFVNPEHEYTKTMAKFKK
jgi:hypothetical protein